MPASTPISAPDFVLTPFLIGLVFVEALLVLSGLFLLLRNPRALVRRMLGLAPAKLTASPHRLSEIFLAGAFAFGAAIILQVFFVMVGKRYCPPPVDGSMGFFHVLVAAGFQLGLVAGLAHAWFWHLRPGLSVPVASPTAESPVSGFSVVREGFLTFLVVLPAVWLASLLWQSFLELLGIVAPPQDIVALFAKRGDWVSLSAMIGFALVCAPIAEELLFRVGLFRWLRGRIARSLAFILPALAFAMLHGSVSVLVPLMVLSIIFSLSYERSGHPAVTMIAHSLFNLNTLVLVLAGFPTSDADLRSAFQQLVSFLN